MLYLTATLLGIALAATVWLLVQVRRQQTRLTSLQGRLDKLADIDMTEEPDILLTLRVVDPLALARRESRSARVLGDRLPITVKKMVYQQVMREVAEELKQRNVEAIIQMEYR
ncbi:MAG: hypothetical protein LAT63_09555 [Marinobacter sp.]|nr:hypothetical protein [Marinobacter sp.]